MFFVDFFTYILFQLLQFYKYAVIIYVIISMLVSFNIINTNNKIISIIMDFLFRLIEPLLRVIRKVIPSFGAIDISPVILILALMFFRNLVFEYLAPSLF